MFFSLSRGKVDLQKYSGILLLDKMLSGKGVFKPSYLNNTSMRSVRTAICRSISWAKRMKTTTPAFQRSSCTLPGMRFSRGSLRIMKSLLSAAA